MKKLISIIFHLSLARIVHSIRARLITPPDEAYKLNWYTIASQWSNEIFIELPEKGYQGWKDMIDGTYDQFIFEAASTSAKSDAVVYDIGAHFGYTTLVFSNLFASGEVIAFEPNPHNFNQLERNLGKNNLFDRVSIRNHALGNSNSNVEFVFSDNLWSSQSSGSYVREVNPPLPETQYSSFKAMKVPLQTIDSLLDNAEIKPPNLMKIDAEGSEYSILLGAKRCLEVYQPTLLIEVHNITALFNCMTFLNDLGYDVSMIDEENNSTSRCFIWCKTKER